MNGAGGFSGTITASGGTFTSAPSQLFFDNVFWADQGITGAFYVEATGEIVPVSDGKTWAVGAVIVFGLVVYHYRSRLRLRSRSQSQSRR